MNLVRCHAYRQTLVCDRVFCSVLRVSIRAVIYAWHAGDVRTYARATLHATPLLVALVACGATQTTLQSD